MSSDPRKDFRDKICVKTKHEAENFQKLSILTSKIKENFQVEIEKSRVV